MRLKNLKVGEFLKCENIINNVFEQTLFLKNKSYEILKIDGNFIVLDNELHDTSYSYSTIEFINENFKQPNDMQKMFIPLHSVTDLITNSSTTIFTYSESSVTALEDMINELFKTLNINKTCEDVFKLVVIGGDQYLYSEYIAELKENDENYPEGITEETDVREIFDKVKYGELEKPDWFNKAEEKEHWSGYRPDTYLHIIAKDKSYENLAKLIYNFLYSTDHEATYNG